MKIVLALAVTLFFIACSDNKADKEQEEISHSIEKIVEEIKEESAKTSVKEGGKVLEESQELKLTKTSEVFIAKKSSIDGGTLFAKCSGSYGGSMKGVMKPQVNKLSDDEIKAVSEYISQL